MGIISGFDDGEFRPNEPVSRIQFIKMLDEATEHINDLQLTVSFIDLDSNHWEYPYLESALQKSFVPSDYEDNSLIPTKKITREEMAVMVTMALELNDVQSPPFKDQELISEEYVDEVEAAAGTGLLQGFEDWTFRPLV